MLFYTGKTSYTGNCGLIDLFEDPEFAQELFGFGDYQIELVDLTTLSDEEIVTHGNGGLLEFTMKHVYEEDVYGYLRKVCIFARKQKSAGKFFSKVVIYISNVKEEVDKEKFFSILNEEAADYQEETMTIAAQLKQEGEEIGIQKGEQIGVLKGKLEIAKNLLADGMNEERVKKIAALSDEEIDKLINQAPPRRF